MKEIIYGTTNPAKLSQVRDVLTPLGITVKGLADFDLDLDIEEDSQTVLENARKKALTYSRVLGRQVLSMDAALYFKGLPDDQQPGLHVRRFSGEHYATDDEMLAHYTTLIANLGDRVKGFWRTAFAVATPEGQVTSLVRDIPRIFVSRPSQNVFAGYPLESLQIDLQSGQYIADMTEEERADFWRRTTGRQLTDFISGLNDC